MQKNKKAFTLIELLIVISIIGILSSIVLVSLNEGRVKALDAKYITYVSGVTTLVEAAMATEDLNDSIPNGSRGCLGNYPSNDCWSGAWNNANPVFNVPLEAVGEIPEGLWYPHVATNGTIIYKYSGYIRVYAYTSSRTALCEKFGWRTYTTTSWGCYTNIPF